MTVKKVKVIEKRTSDNNKNRKSPLSTVIWVLLAIFVGLPILIIIIALLVGMSSGSNTSVESTQNNTSNVNVAYSANMTIDKVPVTLANLYPVRVSITNTGTKTIYPKFDIVVQNSSGINVCDGSSFVDDFGTIYSGDSKTGEISFLGCIFNEDGDYKITITLIDNSYNKIAESTKDFSVDYWSSFGVSNSNNTNKTYDANLEIKKVSLTFSNLDPVRVTVNNNGDSLQPKFDYTVKNGSDIVFEGSGEAYEIIELDSNSETTFEVYFLGCMFEEDGDYVLKIDLLDPNYNILSTAEKSFEVDYWSQWN